MHRLLLCTFGLNLAFSGTCSMAFAMGTDAEHEGTGVCVEDSHQMHGTACDGERDDLSSCVGDTCFIELLSKERSSSFSESILLAALPLPLQSNFVNLLALGLPAPDIPASHHALPDLLAGVVLVQ